MGDRIVREFGMDAYTLLYLKWITKRELLYGFPDSSVGKESACNAEDPGPVPGLGRSPGEGIGHPLQYSWASLVAHLIICPQCGRPGFDSWVGKIFLGWEDPLEKGKVTHSGILAWRIPWTL